MSNKSSRELGVTHMPSFASAIISRAGQKTRCFIAGYNWGSLDIAWMEHFQTFVPILSNQ